MSVIANLIDQAKPLSLEKAADGTLSFRFESGAGLYQFSVVADASKFNWDELYTVLNNWHGIDNERTGPWDFHLFENSRPLVPSYWVTVNGRQLGLWFFQRVSVEDVAAKRFRGRMAFHVAAAGPVTVELKPYRTFEVDFLSAVLERDPEDSLEKLPFAASSAPARVPAAEWAKPAFWDKRRQELATTHAKYQKPLRGAFDWILKRGWYAPVHMLMLTAAYRMDGTDELLQKVLAALDEAIAKPHWGNPREDGYSHNGDMGAASSLFALAWTWHALAPELGAERKARLEAKLQLQGVKFFHLALLNRDYWGGSVLQDHGRISVPLFGAAATLMLGVLPEAELWTQYAIPRVRRAIHAMPRDGLVPLSSYGSLASYMDQQTWLRDIWLPLSGQDLFDEGPFREIVNYINETLRPHDFKTIVDGLGVAPFIGGNAFLNRIATKYQDARAAFLQNVLVESPMLSWSHPVQEEAFYNGALWGFLTYDPQVRPVAKLPTAKPLTYFQDSGLAHHYNPAKDVTFSVRCGPWIGYHAYRQAQGPCDRMGIAPGAGHFTLALGQNVLLATPDQGYKLRSITRTCLLVDDEGQIDNVGYPMSIPSKIDRGEEIQFAKWDETSKTGWVRLNLAPAYPASLGIAYYVRDFLIHADKLICRDQVVCSRPRQFSWLFQGKRETGIALVNGQNCRFGTEATIDLEPKPLGFAFKAAVQETPVVWSYSSGSGFKPFDHVRYDAAEPMKAATVEFVFKW